MRLPLALGLIAAMTVLTACGAGGSSNPSSSSASGGASSPAVNKVTNVGLLSDLPRNDGSFGQMTAEGAQSAADELGAKLTIVDGVAGKPSESMSALTNLAETNQVVVVVATAVMSSLPQVAAQYPDVTFAVIDQPIDGVPNIFYQVQDWYPLGYLAGVAAATESKSGTVGFISGGQIPPTVRAQAGYTDGAMSVNPNIKVLNTDTNNFDDPTLAKGAAAAQLAEGADVMASFLNTAHAGVVQAAVEAGGTAQIIGVISPHCEESQGLLIGDVGSDHAASIEELVLLAAQGETESAVIGLTDPNIQKLAFCETSKAGDKVQPAVEAAWNGLASGEIETPPAG
jgi:basic membrane protein A and related proteins